MSSLSRDSPASSADRFKMRCVLGLLNILLSCFKYGRVTDSTVLLLLLWWTTVVSVVWDATDTTVVSIVHLWTIHDGHVRRVKYEGHDRRDRNIHLHFLPRYIECRAVYSSHKKVVCPSVCLSNACIVTKWMKDLSRFFIPYEILQPSFLRRRMVAKGDPFQYVIQTPLGGVDPLTSDNTPSSDPKPDPL